MIKSDKGRVELRGSEPLVLAEYTTLTKNIIAVLVEKGKSKEEAKARITECFELASLSAEELEERTMEAEKEIKERVMSCIDELFAELKKERE